MRLVIESGRLLYNTIWLLALLCSETIFLLVTVWRRMRRHKQHKQPAPCKIELDYPSPSRMVDTVSVTRIHHDVKRRDRRKSCRSIHLVNF